MVNGPKRIRFSRSEVGKMEKLLEERKEELSDISFIQKLTDEFNQLPSRAGKKAIQVMQIQRWFRKRKRLATEATDTSLSNNVIPEIASDMRGGVQWQIQEYIQDTGEKGIEQEELEFEARSSTDNAWYDVAQFLKHRFLSSGEPEVRVRFHGFGPEEDEWVIVKDVRERSIPLESTECLKVEVGNLVLCFQERTDQAKYFDAHVLEIQRKLHDIRGCRCLFLVRYDHDQTEERVNLRRLCRRPEGIFLNLDGHVQISDSRLRF